MSISRRGFLSAFGALGLGSVTAGQAQAMPGKRRRLAVDDTAFVDVTAATLWCAATIDGVRKEAWDLPRTGIDDPSLTNPVDLRAWNANMSATETRAWLSSNGVLETQGVMGTPVIVTDIHDDWVKVIIPAQPTPRSDGTFNGVNGYPGWLPAVQLARNPVFAKAIGHAPLARVTSVYAWLSSDPTGLGRTAELSFGTALPVLGRMAGAVRILRPNGDGTQWLRASDVVVQPGGMTKRPPTGREIVETGLKLLGIRYLWAGVSSFGFDCSGFTYTCYRHHGITLHRDANPQMWNSGGRPIETRELTPDPRTDADAYNLAAWQPGDLVFFGKRSSTSNLLVANHVGMCADSGSTDPRILHSPNSSTVAKLQPLSELLGDKRLVGVRRYLDRP